METTNTTPDVSTTRPGADPRVAIGYAIALAVLWIALTIWRPATTFHLAPVLVAGVVPVGAKSLGVGQNLSRLAITGATLALITTGVLSATGRLAGPSLLPSGGAALESAIGALVGAVFGWAIALSMSRPTN